jgi:hypothetical protein
VAQIDHLIVNRRLDFHVLESKGYSREIRISELGEWETKTRYGWKGIQSPIEQNRRHIEVLKSFVTDHQLLPKRLGMTLQPTFHNWVLVSPTAQLRRQADGLETVVKMDMFESAFMKRIDREGMLETFAAMSKFVSPETVIDLAQALIRAHKPAAFNFGAKFGISPEVEEEIKYGPPIATPPPLPSKCETCSTPVEAKVVNYCRLNSRKFSGKLLCQTCQKSASSTISCDSCGTALDDKVIAFCRFNSKRFGGKKVCRSCQPSVLTS